MKSLQHLLFLGTLATCLVLPSVAFGQINLKLPKNGSVKISDSLTDKDGTDKVRKSACKIYTIDLAGGKSYQLDMIRKADKAGNKIDPYLRLEDADGKELATDDDGGGDLNVRIIFNAPQTGKYRIIATTFAGGTGLFDLSVKPVMLITGTGITLADGKVEVQGVLGKDDPKDTARTSSVCKVYTIKLSAGKSYQIDMVSKEIDSYLRLEDSAGKELAKDDDGGGNLNARIIFACTADGTYRIIATTFNSGTGPFTLTINQK